MSGGIYCNAERIPDYSDLDQTFSTSNHTLLKPVVIVYLAHFTDIGVMSQIK